VRRKLVIVLALVLTLAFAGVAAHAATTLTLSSDRVALKYNKKLLVAKPGRVTIVMTNPSFLKHDVAIKVGRRVIVKGKVVGRGGISRASAVLKRGTYRFFCSVPGHEAGGMWGTLRVR
jgi:plastocyanin